MSHRFIVPKLGFDITIWTKLSIAVANLWKAKSLHQVGQLGKGVDLAPVRLPIAQSHGRKGVAIGETDHRWINLTQWNMNLSSLGIPTVQPRTRAQYEVMWLPSQGPAPLLHKQATYARFQVTPDL